MAEPPRFFGVSARFLFSGSHSLDTMIARRSNGQTFQAFCA